MMNARWKTLPARASYLPMLTLVLASLLSGSRASTGTAIDPAEAAGAVPQRDVIPRPGTLDWARSVSEAWEDARQAKTPREMVARYQRLLKLNEECKGCRRDLARFLEHQLALAPGNDKDLQQLVALALADDQASVGRFWIKIGRPEEAKRVVADSLDRAQSVERRLQLLEILAEADMKLGRIDSARRLARKLLQETPVSPNYCEKALRWWSWLGEGPEPDFEYIHPQRFVDELERVRDLERTRGNVPYVSCLHNQYLITLDRLLRGLKEIRQAPTELQSLFPKGIESAQLQLARRTADRTVKASILLDASRRVSLKSPPEALSIVREALRDGPQTKTKVGALVMELNAIPIHERKEEVEQLALRLIDGYQDYDASCDGCAFYWYSLIYPWPEFSNRIPEWEKKCRKRMARCPIETWSNVSIFFPAAHEPAQEVYEGLLSMDPPEEVVPGLLLRLRAAVATTDPKRGWELAREAVRHPEFPGVAGKAYPGVSSLDAERAGDFETALFLDLLSGPVRVEIGSCISGDRSGEIERQFRRAYYETQLGINAHGTWTELLSLLPTNPDDPSLHAQNLPLYLERIVNAAKLIHQESSALEWLRALQRQYRDVRSRIESGDKLALDNERLQSVESLIEESIQQLEVPASSAPP